MNRLPIYFLVIVILVFIVGCMSLTPKQFVETFPTMTQSKYYGSVEANDAISNGECKLLIKDRKYTAPIGLTARGDAQNGATGVDEWVKTDKGNSYAINNFEWISVGDQGNTQLIVYFNTMFCN